MCVIERECVERERETKTKTETEREREKSKVEYSRVEYGSVE